MTWSSLHCQVSWRPEHVDAFIVDRLAPLFDDDWFFVRETGTRLRICYRGDLDLRDTIQDLVATADYPLVDSDSLPHGDVREMPYEPETGRYGGPEALPLAEDLFCRSTEAALAVLRSGSPKLSAAIDLTIATTKALELDRAAAASWLHAMDATPSESHRTARRILAKHGKEIHARWCRSPDAAAARWADQIRAVRATMDLPLTVWASQLHMLFNRIGITPGLERMVCWLVATSALCPAGMVVLPMPDVLITPLDTALKARHTSRGKELDGTLDIHQLSTLLSTAQGGRPYPSADARYCARIRLVALDVRGLAPGCYEFDEVAATLTWTGPCPSVPDLERTSASFGPDATGLAGTPAVLALYVRIGDLRPAYGGRAARFAFVEAGHLAQNLGLVAAAMGLSIGTVGDFTDDLAHDLLGLDGTDDTLVHLLPVARVSLDDAQ